MVIIFDECHRSQFGAMHSAIVKYFKKYFLFGFTGTPIFAENAQKKGDPRFATTPQLFGESLHRYTIVDAINDGNVLPFRIDYVNTMKQKEDKPDQQVEAIASEKALRDPDKATFALGGIRISLTTAREKRRPFLRPLINMLKISLKTVRFAISLLVVVTGCDPERS